MKYTSTRDSSVTFSFEDALCSGYSPDGGLFVPQHLPNKVDPKILKSWSTLSFPELAFQVMRMFISSQEISDNELNVICTKSFVKGFESVGSKTIPLKKIGSTYFVELFHGPTFCFKDLGMRAVVNMLSFFASKRERKIKLIVSTTGDTGPAAVQAVSDASNPLLTLLVHYPLGQISAFQRKQLTTANSPYVKVATFEGGGDDMDAPIKRILASSNTNSNDVNATQICGVNSYNIGRPLVQMVHFIWTYLRVAEDIGIEPGDQTKPVDIILPTGAMGNIAGGYMAKKMGVPIGKLCAGVNSNDITHRVITTGEFHKSSEMLRTLSEAINIQVPYNFERLLYYLTGEDDRLVNTWMKTMESTSKLDLDDSWQNKMKEDFQSASITDDEMCKSMKEVYNKLDYFIDPHTTIAVAAAEKLGYDVYSNVTNQTLSPYAILSTAAPCKFEESVTVGLGLSRWTEYVTTQFPTQAKSVLEKKEIKPKLYKWVEGETLEGVQKKWEQIARSLVMES
mmetsp:Transcript_14140/g.17166  ORF Transcript_14140/g.17166 Transcript_14140/m.17166 type:complete len:509 (+) Transcript_14140:181-1707(+)